MTEFESLQMRDALAANASRFSGFADLYDAVRPTPPDDLATLLISYSGAQRE